MSFGAGVAVGAGIGVSTGNGAGGEGYANYSIACTTGEGICTPMTYTRWRRCTMVDNLRIV